MGPRLGEQLERFGTATGGGSEVSALHRPLPELKRVAPASSAAERYAASLATTLAMTFTACVNFDICPGVAADAPTRTAFTEVAAAGPPHDGAPRPLCAGRLLA